MTFWSCHADESRKLEELEKEQNIEQMFRDVMPALPIPVNTLLTRRTLEMDGSRLLNNLLITPLHLQAASLDLHKVEETYLEIRRVFIKFWRDMERLDKEHSQGFGKCSTLKYNCVLPSVKMYMELTHCVLNCEERALMRLSGELRHLIGCECDQLFENFKSVFDKTLWPSATVTSVDVKTFVNIFNVAIVAQLRRMQIVI